MAKKKKNELSKPRKRGRPKGTADVWTPELKAKVCGAITMSGFTNVALEYLGLSESAFYHAMAADPQFKEDVKKAKATRKMHSLAVVRGANAWQAHAWWLERTDPKTFGRRVALQHEGKVDTTIGVRREDFQGRTIEELDAMLKRLEKLETEEVKEAEIIKKELAET